MSVVTLPALGRRTSPWYDAEVPVDRRIEDGGEVHTRDFRTGVRGWHALNANWSLRYHLDGRRLRTPQSPQLALAQNGLGPRRNCLARHQTAQPLCELRREFRNINRNLRQRRRWDGDARTPRWTGAERTRGVELDVRGTPTSNLELVASYAYLDSRITDDSGIATDAGGHMIMTPGNTGHRLFGVPRDGGSAWMTYRPQGTWQGLKLGVGAVARSWRDGDNQNDYTLPGFLKWRLLAGYELPWAEGQFAVQLKLDNASNTRYFESISNTHSVMPGAPRRWLVTFRWIRDPPR